MYSFVYGRPFGAVFRQLQAVRCTHSHPTIERVRNIGVVAHIDAGKTTLTERLLYLSGELKRMGDVDKGSTVTDFLEVERERGITVQSAVVSLPWKGNRINLIDTPGHVDFGVEVQRCVRVLDGLLVVLDGSAGVQAQTLTVWRQASRYSLPSVFLINKMDKPQADFFRSVQSIEDKLGVKALPVMVPFNREGRLESFIDLLSGEVLRLGEEEWSEVQGKTAEWDVLGEQRETLCLGLADSDEQFSQKFFEEAEGDSEAVGEAAMREALTRVSLSRQASAVSCASALRSAPSVRPCLDYICDLLPSPDSHAKILQPVMNNHFSGLLFKISHDPRKGRLAYTRVYSGTLRSGSHLWNWTRQRKEGPIEIFEPQSDELEGVRSAEAGSMVVLRGLENSLTGDTLLALECDEMQPPEFNEAASNLVFEGIEQPDPVFYCSIEPPDIKGRHALERALKELVVEDPSLRVRLDTESGQTILETMGELHVEIVKDRLVRGYGLNAFLGPLQVAYREVVQDTVEHTETVEDTVDGRSFSVTVSLRVEPDEGAGKWKRLRMALPPGSRSPRPDWLKGLKEGISSSLHHGPILAFPVYDVTVSLIGLTASGGKVGGNMVCAAAHKCMEGALRKGGARLVEPIMEIEVSLPIGCPSQGVLHELTKRRAVIEEVVSEDAKESTICASLPLSSLSGLSSAVRTLSRGLAHLNVRLTGHQMLDGGVQNKLIAERRRG